MLAGAAGAVRRPPAPLLRCAGRLQPRLQGAMVRLQVMLCSVSIAGGPPTRCVQRQAPVRAGQCHPMLLGAASEPIQRAQAAERVGQDNGCAEGQQGGSTWAACMGTSVEPDRQFGPLTDSPIGLRFGPQGDRGWAVSPLLRLHRSHPAADRHAHFGPACAAACARQAAPALGGHHLAGAGGGRRRRWRRGAGCARQRQRQQQRRCGRRPPSSRGTGGARHFRGPLRAVQPAAPQPRPRGAGGGRGGGGGGEGARDGAGPPPEDRHPGWLAHDEARS